MKQSAVKTIWILDDDDALLASMRKAVRAAVKRHKLLGNPIAEERDGKVVIIQPEDIVIDEDD